MKNLNVAVREWQDEVVFLHKIVDGAADKSYGIHVARLAGVPARGASSGPRTSWPNWKTSTSTREGRRQDRPPRRRAAEPATSNSRCSAPPTTRCWTKSAQRRPRPDHAAGRPAADQAVAGISRRRKEETTLSPAGR